MDLEYMGRLLLSFAIFAPGLILLAFLSFLGLVMLAEKANMFRRAQRASLEAQELVARGTARNPAPGSISTALTEEIASETSAAEEAPEARVSNVHTLRKGN